MTGLILKLSYNNIGENPVTGGICGSFFFIQNDIAVTANHVLNKKAFVPNEGFKYCQLWLMIQPDYVFELNSDNFVEYPEIDTSVIKFDKAQSIPVRKISKGLTSAGQACFNEGFVFGKMPELSASWGYDKLIITGCMFKDVTANGAGYIKDVRIEDVHKQDVKLDKVKVLELSYGGIRGMSGGPLINKQTDEIIGLMSFGFPENVDVKEILYAVSIEELNRKFIA